jgi:hypothetical protein
MDGRSAPAYTGFMGRGRLHRPAVALVAAYALALQALLSAFVPVAPALSAAVAALCAPDGDVGSGHPLQHDPPCAAICAALGHGIAEALPPAIVVAVATPLAVAALTPGNEWVPPRIAIRGPKSARAPPLA